MLAKYKPPITEAQADGLRRIRDSKSLPKHYRSQQMFKRMAAAGLVDFDPPQPSCPGDVGRYHLLTPGRSALAAYEEWRRSRKSYTAKL